MTTPIRVHSYRGEYQETRHDVAIAVADSSGMLLATQGEPSRQTLLRSAAKPFQAVPLFDGARDRFSVTDREVALACASHNSEVAHVELVRAFLDRIDVDPAQLVCGSHRSLVSDLGYHLEVGGEDRTAYASPSSVASNCSGKHAGMLAVARHHDWNLGEYHLVGSPVQNRCGEVLAERCGVPRSEIGTAGDGCGVVCWSLPLVGLARGYATLAEGRDEPSREIVAAMSRHPHLVAGTRRLCTALMQAYAGQVVAKVGAGGVYAAALLERKIGVAIKVLDGNSYAAGTALLVALESLGLLERPMQKLAPFATPVLLDTRGHSVGRYAAEGSIRWL